MGFNYYRTGSLVGISEPIAKDASAVYDLKSKKFNTSLVAGRFSKFVEINESLYKSPQPGSNILGNMPVVQSIIESADPSFNCFACVGNSAFSENLIGQSRSNGKGTLQSKQFLYNSNGASSPAGVANVLSTGNAISHMSGAGAYDSNLTTIDGLSWMAMAFWNGTTSTSTVGGSTVYDGYQGIIIWAFTGDGINNSGTVTSNGRPITYVRDIFQSQTSSNYAKIFGVGIAKASGSSPTITYTPANAGYNFSNNQQPDSRGYNQTGKFAADDGIWGMNMNQYIDGNTPGPDFSSVNKAYGMGNYNGGDGNNECWWDGTNNGGNNSLIGIVFSGDA